MANQVVLNQNYIIKAAEYVYKNELCRYIKHSQKGRHRLNQPAIYLTTDNQILHATDLKDKIDINTGNIIDAAFFKKIAKVIIRPNDGIVFSLIQAKMIPFITNFYTTVLPEHPSSKLFKTLSSKEIQDIQLMALFTEVRKNSPSQAFDAAQEYIHYLKHKIKLTKKDYWNALSLEIMLSKNIKSIRNDISAFNITKILNIENIPIPKIHTLLPKIELLKEANILLHQALYLENNKLPESFSSLIEYISSDKIETSRRHKFESYLKYLNYLARLFKNTGLHKNEFIYKIDIQSPASNLEFLRLVQTILMPENAEYTNQLFLFTSNLGKEESEMAWVKNTDVLIAWKTISSVPKEVFVENDYSEFLKVATLNFTPNPIVDH